MSFGSSVPSEPSDFGKIMRKSMPILESNGRIGIRSVPFIGEMIHVLNGRGSQPDVKSLRSFNGHSSFNFDGCLMAFCVFSFKARRGIPF